MAPLLTKEMYAARALYNPAPGSIHVLDLIHKDQHYLDRTSDFVTGMLLLAVELGVIKKTEACYFQVPFTIGAKLRISQYKHQGHPLLGPDGLAFMIKDYTGDNRVFGGAAEISKGAYDLKNVRTAPNYMEWLRGTLYAGRDQYATDFRLAGMQPPLRVQNGVIKRPMRPFLDVLVSTSALRALSQGVSDDGEEDDRYGVTGDAREEDNSDDGHDTDASDVFRSDI